MWNHLTSSSRVATKGCSSFFLYLGNRPKGTRHLVPAGGSIWGGDKPAEPQFPFGHILDGKVKHPQERFPVPQGISNGRVPGAPSSLLLTLLLTLGRMGGQAAAHRDEPVMSCDHHREGPPMRLTWTHVTSNNLMLLDVFDDKRQEPVTWGHCFQLAP